MLLEFKLLNMTAQAGAIVGIKAIARKGEEVKAPGDSRCMT